MIDNKAEKYYGFSPYMYAANNPLVFIDVDGNDFKVAITGSTITISATYYYENDEAGARLDAALSDINAASGKFSYKTDGGDSYDIVFKLTKQESSTGENPGVAADDDDTGNGFNVKSDFAMNIDFPRSVQGESLEGGDEINVRRDPKGISKKTLDKHEVLHTVGASHKTIGAHGAKITKNTIGQILNYASSKDENSNLNTSYKKGNKLFEQPLRHQPKAKIVTEDGTAVNLNGIIEENNNE